MNLLPKHLDIWKKKATDLLGIQGFTISMEYGIKITLSNGSLLFKFQLSKLV